MPKLIFPIAPEGRLVPVLLTPERAHLQTLAASGQSLPAPLACRGLIDTGSDLSGLAPHVVAALGIAPGKTVRTQTASGEVEVDLYDVSFSGEFHHFGRPARLGLALYDGEQPAHVHTSRPNREVLTQAPL